MEIRLCIFFFITFYSFKNAVCDLSAQSVFEMLSLSISHINNRVGNIESDLKKVKDTINNLETIVQNVDIVSEHSEKNYKHKKGDFNQQLLAWYKMLTMEKENVRENIKQLNEKFIGLTSDLRTEINAMRANFSQEFVASKTTVEHIAEKALNITFHNVEATKASLSEIREDLNSTVEVLKSLQSQKASCGALDIDVTKYNVYNSRFDPVNPSMGHYPHGTFFQVDHKSEMCAPTLANYTCDEGTWIGELPECASCRLPLDNDKKRKLYDRDGVEMDEGAYISHGSTVSMQCPRGHVPDDFSTACSYGKLDIPIPTCTLVNCPKPSVGDMKYEPVKSSYVYGDEVNVERCSWKLEFVGSRHLKCQRNGNWSDTAECREFCAKDIVTFEYNRNSAFRDEVWKQEKGVGSFEACERSCRNMDRFLCRAFVYGFENGKRYCLLYPYNPEDFPDIVIDKPFWTIGVRKCVPRE